MDNGEENLDKIIDEEYKIWKKNTPFLYDVVVTHSLEWPSLTVQWLPDYQKIADREVSVHKLLLGTHTSNEEPNYLMIADITLPLPETEIDARCYDDSKGEVGGYGGVLNKIDVKIKINHEGEVNRARVMPQNSFIVATKSPSSTVFVFDYSKHPSTPQDGTCRPQHRLLGHTHEGYGLAWSPHETGNLLSGSDDGNICLWDIRDAGLEVQPKLTRRAHESVVEDVAWHQHNPHLFGSVGDDSNIILWDPRKDSAMHTIAEAHSEDINCIAFNPFSEYLFATGSTDNTVALWDLRKMDSKLHSFTGHTSGVYQINWAPFNETILGSCSADRRVHIWDLSRIGDEQTEEDAEDGPPELLFVHGGHSAKVSDFSWNLHDNWVMASVAEDNILQVWQMAETIYNDDEDDDVADEDLEENDEEKDEDESAAKKQKTQ